jgi:hypothetical protein
MATIRREIEIEGPPSVVSAGWERFVAWVLIGPRRLLCDEIACVDAVRTGRVSFTPSAGGNTSVTFSLPDADDELPADALGRQLGQDLVVFKDYVERGGMAAGRPTSVEEIALEKDAQRRGDKPRHVRLSSEDGTTFWRSHFPT